MKPKSTTKAKAKAKKEEIWAAERIVLALADDWDECSSPVALSDPLAFDKMARALQATDLLHAAVRRLRKVRQ